MTEKEPGIPHALDLERGELLVACVVAVIHPVVDWVETGLIWARITTDWALGGRTLLSWRISNHIGGFRAGPDCVAGSVFTDWLAEGVSKTHPVTDFMEDSAAEVVVGECTAWNGLSVVGGSIDVELLRTLSGVSWVVGVSQSIIVKSAEEVEVEGGVVALAESCMQLVIAERGNNWSTHQSCTATQRLEHRQPSLG